MDRDVLSELRDARTIINDGCNERGTLLSGERCKACVRYIDHAILLLKEQEAVEAEIEGGGSSWWYVCGECHGTIDRADQYCRHCGRKVMTE